MRLPRIIGGPCSVQVVVGRHADRRPRPCRSAFCHGRPQMLTTSGLQRIADVERPDDALVPPLRIVGQEGELCARCRRRTGADRCRACRRSRPRFGASGLADVEDVEAGAGVAARVAGQALGIHVEKVVADDAQLVAMHAGRRLELPHLLRLARIAHVVDREPLGAGEPARGAADRADIGIAVVHLDQAAAAPRGGRIVAEQAEVPWLPREILSVMVYSVLSGRGW